MKEMLLDGAVTVDSNGDMATKVGQDANGFGYVSLSTDFEANNIKALNYEGVTPSEETVLDGSYGMQRPFMFVTRADGDFADDRTQAAGRGLHRLHVQLDRRTAGRCGCRRNR